MDALPIEVRAALDRMPTVATAGEATALARGLARNGLHVLRKSAMGREAETRRLAAHVAAAGIRLVEYCNQDWP